MCCFLSLKHDAGQEQNLFDIVFSQSPWSPLMLLQLPGASSGPASPGPASPGPEAQTDCSASANKPILIMIPKLNYYL